MTKHKGEIRMAHGKWVKYLGPVPTLEAATVGRYFYKDEGNLKAIDSKTELPAATGADRRLGQESNPPAGSSAATGAD